MLPAETILIAGPTGAGKTELSLWLAGSLGGEIVGADAFQIYKGLPILTAQPTKESLAGIPHHLIGSVDPSESHDAGRYLGEALAIIRDIAARGKRPIVVGGTGLYFKALLGGLQDMPKMDPALRSLLRSLTLPDLVERLGSLDADALRKIDSANRRRVERALEIVMLTGKPLAASRTGAVDLPNSNGVAALLITRDREELKSRITGNVTSMFLRGVEQEVASFPEETIGPTASMTLGLREIRALLRGEISPQESKDAIDRATRRYAKRQMTWFRNQHDFPELNLSRFPDTGAAGRAAIELLGSSI